MTNLTFSTLLFYGTLLGILVLTSGLAWATYRSNQILKNYKPDFNLLLSIPELITRLILVSICLLLAWSSGLSQEQLGFVSPNLLWSTGIAIGLGILLQAIINPLMQAIINRFGAHLYSPIVVQSILPRRSIEWIPVSLALIPAVAMEEILFRTLWLGVLGTVLPIPILIVVSSIIFGFMHQPQGTLGMILTGTINIIFCLLFIWRGELLIPLVTHYIINMLQLVVAYRNQDQLTQYPSIGDVDKSIGA